MNKKTIKPKTYRQCLLMPCFANENGKCMCLDDLKKGEKPYNYTDYKCPFFKMNVNDGAKEIIVKRRNL